MTIRVVIACQDIPVLGAHFQPIQGPEHSGTGCVTPPRCVTPPGLKVHVRTLCLALYTIFFIFCYFSWILYFPVPYY